MVSQVCALPAFSSIASRAFRVRVPRNCSARLSQLFCDELSPRQFSMSSLDGVALVVDRDIWEASPMNGALDGAPPLNGAHYREIAHGLRRLARECRFAGARRELLQLAASYDRRADHFDGRER